MQKNSACAYLLNILFVSDDVGRKTREIWGGADLYRSTEKSTVGKSTIRQQIVDAIVDESTTFR